MSNSYPEMELLENAIKAMKQNPSDESVEQLVNALTRTIDCKKALYSAWPQDGVETNVYDGRYEAQTLNLSRIPVVRLDGGDAFLQIATRKKFLQLGNKAPMMPVNLPLVMAIDLIKEHDTVKGIVFNANSLRPLPVAMDVLDTARARSTFAGRNSLDDFMGRGRR